MYVCTRPAHTGFKPSSSFPESAFYLTLREFLPLHPTSFDGILILPSGLCIEHIQAPQRQLQELMFIPPLYLTLSKLLRIRRRRRRVRDLRNQIRGGSFCDAVDQDAEEGDLEEDVESDAEAEEDAFAVVEPEALLLGGEADA